MFGVAMCNRTASPCASQVVFNFVIAFAVCIQLQAVVMQQQ